MTVFPNERQLYVMISEGRWSYKNKNKCLFHDLFSFFLSHNHTQIIEECNTQVGKMRHMEELIHVSQTLEFDKLRVNTRTHTHTMCMISICPHVSWTFILKKR